MNKLILEVQEQIKKERADAKTEQEKKYVRTMLGVIEGKKDRIERLQRDIKKVEKMMEDKDYSSAGRTIRLRCSEKRRKTPVKRMDI